MNKEKSFSVKLAGRILTLSTGELAERANASVTARYGDTVVLATVVVGKEPREGIDFLPLLVDYEERMYAAGKISGSRFMKREGRPSEAAILNARLIDRPLRPLFPKGFYNDIQVIITVLSVDGENDPAIIGLIAASAALCLSRAPFQRPVVGLRVGLIDDKLIVNPTVAQQELSNLNLVVATTKERVMMIEAAAQEIMEAKVLEAIKLIQKEAKLVFNLIDKMVKELKITPTDSEQFEVKDQIYQELQKFLGMNLTEMTKETDQEKKETKILEFEEQILKAFEGSYKQVELKKVFNDLVQKEFRSVIIEQGIRPDGRKLTEIRPIGSRVGVLPRTHGSALFSRGQTQALSIVTLGGPGEEQMIDTMEKEGEKRFMHHYNFPPYSVGEVQPLRTPGRREIGHGALAEKALASMIPSQEEFPYTIRVVSEILSSNGSSSMAATCGACLALMDAGVPVKRPVAGIAIGLITEEGFDDKKNGKYRILTDIQGIEDFAGDMDFKVAGTKQGITAIQMDMKVKGISHEIITQALEQARDARLTVLAKMADTLAQPRTELSPFAPRIFTVRIPVSKIGAVIGPGGKVINRIIEEAGGKTVTSIDIDEDGLVSISSHDSGLGQQALKTIEALVEEVELGKIYEGQVLSIQKNRASGQEIGAIVQILPGKEGMVHISEISNERIPDVSSRLKIGDKIQVKVVNIDEERDRIALSIKRAKE